MKILLAAFLLTASFAASAMPVFLYPTCSYGSSNGECTLVNTSNQNINCSIQVNGQTKSGARVSATDYRYLYPGMFAWVRVSSNDTQDPITYLHATAFCNSL